MHAQEEQDSSPEDQLRSLRAELEAAVAARDAAEQRASWASDNAHAVSEEMQHFVYAVSHDLRQPLRGVLTSAQLLDRDSTLPPEARESTATIIQGALEMNSLIERLLTFSRVASNLRRSIVPLEAVVQWSLMSLGKLITESGARITYEALPVLEVDESVFAMLFQELFTNSIRFCGEAPPVITVQAAPGESGQIISVRDNGTGVPPEYLEKVFIPFQRLQKKADVPGHGLGLSICRKIIRAHGGRIWMESDGSNGCTVLFNLPN